MSSLGMALRLKPIDTHPGCRDNSKDRYRESTEQLCASQWGSTYPCAGLAISNRGVICVSSPPRNLACGLTHDCCSSGSWSLFLPPEAYAEVSCVLGLKVL